jgi:hypothetical protein
LGAQECSDPPYQFIPNTIPNVGVLSFSRHADQWLLPTTTLALLLEDEALFM